MTEKKLILEETLISTRGKLWCVSGEVVQTEKGHDFHIHTFHEGPLSSKRNGRPDDYEGLERAVENFMENIFLYNDKWEEATK